jgi:CubicO group peptidase (beta-lactamase class C family)
MRKSSTVLVALALTAPACASAPPAAPRIDAQVRQLMLREHVNGLALAVIENGQVAHVSTFGHRNVERALPLTPRTIMYGASLTKTAFAYMLLQLVDERRLSLDASIADLLSRPLPDYKDYQDLRGDERWRQLTPRVLLTHSSGFANFAFLEPDRKLRFHFTPGSRYAYSGQGFYVLQLVLEQGLGLDVSKEMQRRVFDRFHMANTSMTWRADFAADFADGYRLDGTMEPHDERGSVRAAGSMDTSIEDQARMWAGIMRGEGISAAVRAELVRGHLPITSAQQFPTLTAADDPRNAQIKLAAGLGLVTFDGPQGPGWFKGGHNDTTGNMVVCLERGRRCLVMLANDVRAERIYAEITELVLGRTGMPWRWEYGN